MTNFFENEKETFLKVIDSLDDVQINALGRTIEAIMPDEFASFKKDAYNRSDLLIFAVKFKEDCEKASPDKQFEYTNYWVTIITAACAVKNVSNIRTEKDAILRFFKDSMLDEEITYKPDYRKSKLVITFSPKGVDEGFGLVRYTEMSYEDLKNYYEIYMNSKTQEA